MKLNLVFALAVFLAGPATLLHAEDVQVSDFGGKVTLIGRLGKPVGTVAIAEGQIMSEPKLAKTGRSTAVLHVTKVDGQTLAAEQSVAVVFPASVSVSLIHANQVVRLSGYEGGAFIGTPAAAREQMGADASSLSWKFESTFNVIKIQSPDSTKNP
jgi:hypothetical protein